MIANSRQCTNCTRVIAPREGRTPRYCPTCGSALVDTPAESPPVAALLPSHAPPTGGGRQTMGYARVTPRRSGKAVAALVLGLVGIAFCSLLGIVAIIQGSAARREIDASGGALYGRGMATTGLVLGIISLALMGVTALTMFAA